MNTKGILIAILALGSITFTNAQQPAGYFFKEFTSGKVSLKFTSEIIFKDKQQPVKEFIETEKVKIPPKDILKVLKRFQ